MTVLETEALSKKFGGLTAVNEVDLTVTAGEMVGLIGPNGAGKTTLFDCIAGVQDPTCGRVEFDGEDVTDEPPYEHARRGMVRTFQRSGIYPTMSVRENVLVAAKDHPGGQLSHSLLQTDSVGTAEESVRARADELLEEFELLEMSTAYGSELSGGQRQLLEFARAVMLEPTLLMLDEPLAGINPTTTQKVTSRIETINSNGITVVIIEHDIEELVDLVDRLVVMSNGSVLADGAPEEVVEMDRVIDAYLGK
jgi:branched-chain amino acid transport system ATP-binding protein